MFFLSKSQKTVGIVGHFGNNEKEGMFQSSFGEEQFGEKRNDSKAKGNNC
jgi:hypothetical protein